MSTESSLIQRLLHRQIELAESDAQFSVRIGMSRQTWQAVRTGTFKPGRRTLRGVLVAFPEMLPDVTAFLLPADASIPA